MTIRCITCDLWPAVSPKICMPLTQHNITFESLLDMLTGFSLAGAAGQTKASNNMTYLAWLLLHQCDFMRCFCLIPIMNWRPIQGVESRLSLSVPGIHHNPDRVLLTYTLSLSLCRRGRWGGWMAWLWRWSVSVLGDSDEDVWAVGEGGTLHSQQPCGDPHLGLLRAPTEQSTSVG